MAATTGGESMPPPTPRDARLAERHLRDTVQFNQHHAQDHATQIRTTPQDLPPAVRRQSESYNKAHEQKHQKSADDAAKKLTNGYLQRGSTAMMRPPMAPGGAPPMPMGGPPPPMPMGGGPSLGPPPPMGPGAGAGPGPLPLPDLGTPTPLSAMKPPRMPSAKPKKKAKKGKGK